MFVIKHVDGTYFHNKGRIILYETPQQAIGYLEAFTQYAVNRLYQEGADQMDIMTAPMIIKSNSRIMEIDFDINDVECGTVYATDL